MPVAVAVGEQHQKFVFQWMKNSTQQRNHLEVKDTRESTCALAQQGNKMRSEHCNMKTSLILIEQALVSMSNGQSLTLIEEAETRLAKQGGMGEGDVKIKSNNKRGRGRGKPLTNPVLRGRVEESILRLLMTECPPNGLNPMQSMKTVECVTRTPRDIIIRTETEKETQAAVHASILLP